MHLLLSWLEVHSCGCKRCLFFLLHSAMLNESIIYNLGRYTSPLKDDILNPSCGSFTFFHPFHPSLLLSSFRAKYISGSYFLGREALLVEFGPVKKSPLLLGIIRRQQEKKLPASWPFLLSGFSTAESFEITLSLGAAVDTVRHEELPLTIWQLLKLTPFKSSLHLVGGCNTKGKWPCYFASSTRMSCQYLGKVIVLELQIHCWIRVLFFFYPLRPPFWHYHR